MDDHIIFSKRLPWGGNMPLYITTVATVLVEEAEQLNNKEPRKAVHELRRLKKRIAATTSRLQLAPNMNTKQDPRITISQRLEARCPCRLIRIHPFNHQ